MAIGDDAIAAGYALVPDTGENGRVRWGSREINFSRDLIARVRALIPTGKAGYRTAAGISAGTAPPTGGEDGDIYFQIIV
jgi:hypothetical protein